MAKMGRPRTVDHKAREHERRVEKINDQLTRVFEEQRRRVLAIGAPNKTADVEELQTYWRKKRLGDELRYKADHDRLNIDIRR